MSLFFEKQLLLDGHFCKPYSVAHVRNMHEVVLAVIVVMVAVVVAVMAVNITVGHLDEPHERPRQASQVVNTHTHTHR